MFSISEWTVFALPNGAKYFCHPKARVVTDVDITHPATLRKVNKHLEEATRSSQVHHQNQARKQGQGGSAGDGEDTRLVDDTTPLPTGTTTGADWPGGFGKRGGGPRYGYGATSSGFAYWKADSQTHEQGRMMGLEIWLKSLKPGHENGYVVGGHTTSPDRESFAPMTMWVDHLSKTVSVDAPWSKLGPESVKGGDDDDGESIFNSVRSTRPCTGTYALCSNAQPSNRISGTGSTFRLIPLMCRSLRALLKKRSKR